MQIHYFQRYYAKENVETANTMLMLSDCINTVRINFLHADKSYSWRRIVVNATDFNKNSASYTRTGPVLSFFHKPDISYYGGDRGKGILVCGPMGGESVTGTSFAAPWIKKWHI